MCLPRKTHAVTFYFCPALNQLFSNFPLLYIYCSLTWHCRCRIEYFIQTFSDRFHDKYSAQLLHPNTNTCSARTTPHNWATVACCTVSQSDDATLSRPTPCYQAGTSLTDITYTNRLKDYFHVHMDFGILYRSME